MRGRQFLKCPHKASRHASRDRTCLLQLAMAFALVIHTRFAAAFEVRVAWPPAVLFEEVVREFLPALFMTDCSTVYGQTGGGWAGRQVGEWWQVGGWVVAIREKWHASDHSLSTFKSSVTWTYSRICPSGLENVRGRPLSKAAGDKPGCALPKRLLRSMIR